MNSRQKGKRGELDAARVLRLYGYNARRGQQYKGGSDSPDVVGVPGLHIEVKRTERLNLYAALDQAKRDAAAGEIPVVLHRRNDSAWVTILTLSEFMKIYKIYELYAEQENER